MCSRTEGPAPARTRHDGHRQPYLQVAMTHGPATHDRVRGIGWLTVPFDHHDEVQRRKPYRRDSSTLASREASASGAPPSISGSRVTTTQDGEGFDPKKRERERRV